MALGDRLISSKPREESGSKTSKKYVYQKNLSLYLLIQQHESRFDDYVFLFDYHDDLVIMDSSVNPQKLDFFQIKGKDTGGNWTISNLTKAGKSGLSILGKMYLNKIEFPNSTNSLNFISNAKFSFKKLKDGSQSLSRTEIAGTEMATEDASKCNECIKLEHSLTDDPRYQDLTNFYVTILSSQDSPTHCIGALSRLINRINPTNSINPELAYNQVINEVSRKTGNTVGDKSITELEELVSIKGITKSQFLKFLNKAGLYVSVEQEWNDIKMSLENAGVGYIELLKYKNAWRELNARLISDQNNLLFRELIVKVSDLCREKINSGDITAKSSVLEILDIVYSEINEKRIDEFLIKCLIIKNIHDSQG